MNYCDNCAEPLPNDFDCYVVSELPCDIASCNKGESAILCEKCHKEFIK